MSLDPEDRFYKEVFRDGTYDPVLKENCEVVIDVGALAGEFSIWVYHRAKKIYAIEPEKDQFTELEENIKPFPNIYAFKLALTSKDGIVPLCGEDNRGGYRVDLNAPKESTREFVEGKTLATFMKDNDIDHVNILKIDIEDGEKEVFGSEDFKEVADRIDYIIGEHFGEDLQKLLINLGFEYEHYDHGVIFKRKK